MIIPDKLRFPASLLSAAATAIGSWTMLWFFGFTLQAMITSTAGAVLYISFLSLADYDSLSDVDYIQTGEGPLSLFLLYLAGNFFALNFLCSYLVIILCLVAYGALLRLISDRKSGGAALYGAAVNIAVALLLLYLFLTGAGLDITRIVRSFAGPLGSGELSLIPAVIILASSSALLLLLRILRPLWQLHSHGARFMARQGRRSWPVTVLYSLLRSTTAAGTAFCIGIQGCGGLYFRGFLHWENSPLTALFTMITFINVLALAGRFLPAGIIIAVLFAVSYAAHRIYITKRKNLYDRV